MGEIFRRIWGCSPLLLFGTNAKRSRRRILMNRVRDWCVRLYLRQKLIWLLVVLVASAHPWPSRGDSTFVYAVQISATVQTNPPQITLNWEPDPYGATNYVVYRKNKADLSWGAPLAT